MNIPWCYSVDPPGRFPASVRISPGHGSPSVKPFFQRCDPSDRRTLQSCILTGTEKQLTPRRRSDKRLRICLLNPHVLFGLVSGWILRGQLAGLARSQEEWRRDGRTKSSDEVGRATDNVQWKLDLPGRSGSTPIVWNDHILVNVTQADRIELWSVNRRTGAVEWKRPLGGGNRPVRKANMSTPSPVTDGQSIWVLTSTGLLRRFDFEGKELWMRDISRDHGTFGVPVGLWIVPRSTRGFSVRSGSARLFYTDDPSYLLRVDRGYGTNHVANRTADKQRYANRRIPTPLR